MQRVISKIGPSRNFSLVAHSFGTLVALELASMLEELGYIGKLVLVDGSPDMVKQTVNEEFQNQTTDELQISLLFKLVTHMLPLSDLLPYRVRF